MPTAGGTDWRGSRVLVLGAGRTGHSVARFLAGRGARVCVADETAGTPDRALPGVEWILGEPFPAMRDFDLVVPSPGVPPARFADARAVVADIELAAEAIPAPILAVTGSNGKTTTVLLLEAMLRAAGRRARAAGNVGLPALELVGEALDLAVLEVSSFQLELCETFRPDVAVALNLDADHLDRHGSLEAYAAAKARLFAHQRERDTAVLNADDPGAMGLASGSVAERRLFSLRQAPPRGAWIEAGAACCFHEGVVRRVPVPERSAVARESLLAALLAASAVGVSPEEGARAWPGFSPPPHRRERVATQAGVDWVNDSKATNPGAARYALSQCEGPVVWIAGGRDKGGLALDALFETAEHHVREAIWYGEAAERFELANAGRIASTRVTTLEDAVRHARAIAHPGDTVLLSPACASFDHFANYEERGECFRAEVARFAEAERRESTAPHRAGAA